MSETLSEASVCLPYTNGGGCTLRVDNARVYGLGDSIVASGLPKVADYDKEQFKYDTSAVGLVLAEDDRHISRAVKLASCAGGESHDCFLCGIIVQANITAPRYWWIEFGRYHFEDIVSSTSTMHRIRDFVKRYHKREDADVEKIRSCFSDLTDWSMICNFLIYAWNNIDDVEKIKANLPEGWLQTARITTNYRQLKGMYRQRKKHPLKAWKGFCAWIETLPMAKELICVEKEKDNG